MSKIQSINLIINCLFVYLYYSRQDSSGSASLPLPPIPEDLLSDGIYTEIKDCYL